jgi:hypothetical protein
VFEKIFVPGDRRRENRGGRGEKLERGCEGEHGSSCAFLVARLAVGEKIAADLPLATQLSRRACSSDQGENACVLADALEKSLR